MTDADKFSAAFDEAVTDADLFGPGGACPVLVEPGAAPRTILITGGNASGKSFFLKALYALLSKTQEKGNRGNEWIPVSMTMRTSSGLHRAFMFGDEGRESTGRTSLRAVLGGIGTARDHPNTHVLVLDEPDIGLSEGYQAGLGDLIVDFARDLPERTTAFIVVTHSRGIAGRLRDAGATCVRVGDDLRPTAEWLRDGDVPRTAADVETLMEKSRERSRAIQAVINRRIAERDEADAAARPRR